MAALHTQTYITTYAAECDYAYSTATVTVESPTMAEWLQIKLARFTGLNDIEEKKDALAEIKIKLGGLNNREAEEISHNFNVALVTLFSQLTSDDRALLEETCEVLKALLAILDPGDVYEKYSTDISQLITHPEVPVKLLVLNELLSIASNPQKLPILLASTSLLVSIINQIGDDNLKVAETAMAVIKAVGKHKAGLCVLYTGELLRSFARLLAKNDTVSFRVYEVVVDIAKSSKEGLETSAKSGFLNSLINILENDDILLQVNALELMSELATIQEGLTFLEDQEVLRKVGQKIAEAAENPLSTLLVPGLMKFFGNVARLWPNEIFSKYPAVVYALFEVIESGDQTMLGVALDTLGHVASNVEGKYSLQRLGDTMPCALKKLGVVIEKMPTEFRIRALNNLALMLDVKPEEQDNRILSLTQSWFTALSDEPLEMIVSLCKQPFADIRQASLEVLAVIAGQEWGQECMSTFPGLVEFLLDRNIEAFKECKEVKYEVVRRLSVAKREIFDATTMQRFQDFVNQGPFYVDIVTEVAIEGAV